MGDLCPSQIDLDHKYESIALLSIGPFYLQEELSSFFPSGVYSEAQNRGETQEYFVTSFRSFFAFSQIMEDEVENSHLSLLFFERRARGWKLGLEKKEGNCVGFYFNGVTVHRDDIEYIQEICYGQIYLEYISVDPLFKNLSKDCTIRSKEPENIIALQYVLNSQ